MDLFPDSEVSDEVLEMGAAGSGANPNAAPSVHPYTIAGQPGSMRSS